VGRIQRGSNGRYSMKGKEIFLCIIDLIESCFADGKRRYGLDYTVYSGQEAVAFQTLLICTGMIVKKVVKLYVEAKGYVQSQVFEHQSDEIKNIVSVI
jgi:hypothetical protein